MSGAPAAGPAVSAGPAAPPAPSPSTRSVHFRVEIGPRTDLEPEYDRSRRQELSVWEGEAAALLRVVVFLAVALRVAVVFPAVF